MNDNGQKQIVLNRNRAGGIRQSALGRLSLARQRGMTTLGMIIIVVLIGTIAFASLRLTPVYLNYMKVVGVVNGVQKEFDGQKPTVRAIRSSISRRFDVESVG